MNALNTHPVVEAKPENTKAEVETDVKLSVSVEQAVEAEKAVETAKEVEAPKAEETKEQVVAPVLAAPKPEAVEAKSEDPRQLAAKYIERFGSAQGFEYWSKGLSYQAALEQHVKSLSDKVAGLEKRIASADLGATEQLALKPAGEGETPTSAKRLADYNPLADLIKLPNTK